MPLNPPAEQYHAQRPDVRFLLLPLPEFALLPFGGFLDKLRFSADEQDYSRQRYCAWQVLGLTPAAVVSSNGVAVEVQVTPAQIDLGEFDYLVLFGGRSARHTRELKPAYQPLLRQAAAEGVTLVAIDNASFLLAACGLLEGHRVALHWRHVQEFRHDFPRIGVEEERIYCADGKRISCAGGSAAIDLAVELLSRHCGRTRALKGLPDMLVDEARHDRHRLKSLDAEIPTGQQLQRAIALMRSRLAEPTPTDTLAAQLGISRRQLDRLFQRHFGHSAHAHWREMRLQHLHWRLLNSDHSLARLADEVGIADSSYLCKRVRQRFGHSPEALRRHARQAATAQPG